MNQQKAGHWIAGNAHVGASDNAASFVDDSQHPAPRFPDSTQDFDAFWTSYDRVDLPAPTDFDNAVDPSVDGGLNSFACTDDNVALDNFSPLEPPSPNVVSPNTVSPNDVFDLSVLQSLVRQNNPPSQQRQHTLPRRRSKYTLQRPGGASSPINFPTSPSPFQPVAIQRWQNSPPEQEAASLSAIYNAMEEQGPRSGTHTPNFHAYRNHRGASSTTSLDSARSDSSLHSVKSNQSSKSRRGGKVTKPRSSAKTKAKPKDGADRIFKCTFCCDTFKHKYDWMRHEKSLHLNMEEWVCAPYGESFYCLSGGAVLLPTTNRVHCAFCNALDPTSEHLESHKYSACREVARRTFRRKDHLVQHLRLAHCLETLPLIDDWKATSVPVTCRCGFCDAKLTSWDERTDHLAAHFRSGKTMWDWRGDHGFEPAIYNRVKNAFPPYLIAAQSETLVPFSATNKDSLDHTKQTIAFLQNEEASMLPGAVNDAATGNGPGEAAIPNIDSDQGRLWADTLSAHLARFARQQMMLGIVPTDEMFQRESRRVLYHDADDAWNQTVADDPDWLGDFRERAGFAKNGM